MGHNLEIVGSNPRSLGFFYKWTSWLRSLLRNLLNMLKMAKIVHGSEHWFELRLLGAEISFSETIMQ